MQKFIKQNWAILVVLATILIFTVIGIVGFVRSLLPKPPNPIATIEMEDGKKIVIELHPDKAPETVNNFIALANEGFYDGLTFHRTIPEFMIQGGDKNGDGTGDPGYNIKGEFSQNGVAKNNISHTRGVISMARSAYSADSAGSQFFIMVKDNTELDGSYAAFGMVIEGMEVVDELANVEVVTREEGAEGADKPVNPPKIKTITVDTKGVKYKQPTKLEPFDYEAYYNQMMQEYLQQQALEGDAGTTTE